VYVVAVDPEKCESCEDCVNACPQGVFRMLDGVSDPYQTEECVFCETCTQLCPADAITITEL
jgi:NAD-dependent dihydropyrimidine dehydrogenase PreA subunit